MAESIAILFKDVSWGSLQSEVSQIAECHLSEKKHWKYPSNAEYTLSLYEYDSWLDECELSEKQKIVERFGCLPSAILCIELRRTNQNLACEHAKKIAIELLEKNTALVDDAIGKIWNLNQVKQREFLVEYK